MWKKDTKSILVTFICGEVRKTLHTNNIIVQTTLIFLRE